METIRRRRMKRSSARQGLKRKSTEVCELTYLLPESYRTYGQSCLLRPSVSHPETVSSVKLCCDSEFGLGWGQFACRDAIGECARLMRAVTEGLVRRVAAPAEADDGAAG